MYTYTAGATSLDACVPPWAHDGGSEALVERLKDPETRSKIAGQMREPGKDWENLCLLTGSPDRVLLVGFGPDAMKPLTGKTLAEVAKMREQGLGRHGARPHRRVRRRESARSSS